MGMQLFSPKEAKKTHNEEVEEKRRVIRELGEEETRLTRSVNSWREYEKTTITDTKKKVQEETVIAFDEYTTVVGPLKREIEALEERKRVALIPIEEREKEMVLLEQENTKINANLIVKSQQLSTKTEYLITKTAEIDEREQKVIDVEERLKKREEIVIAGETQLAESTKHLNEKWFELYIAQASFDKQVTEHNNKRKAIEQADVINRIALEDKQIEIDNEWIRINDARGVLERSWIELRNK